jgi:hypothetical protein
LLLLQMHLPLLLLLVGYCCWCWLRHPAQKLELCCCRPDQECCRCLLLLLVAAQGLLPCRCDAAGRRACICVVARAGVSCRLLLGVLL